jgi:hypothetical protein
MSSFLFSLDRLVEEGKAKVNELGLSNSPHFSSLVSSGLLLRGGFFLHFYSWYPIGRVS